MHGRGVSAVAALVVASTCAAQLRVANWNVTNYSGGRVAEFQTGAYGVFQGRSLSPDVLIGQEFTSAAGVTSFLSILNTAPGSPGDWAAATFVNGPDTDSAFFYRTSKVTLVGTTTVAVGGGTPNHPRNIMRYDVRLVGYAAPTTVIACYSTHMKAQDSGNDDENRRLLEAQRIRDNAQTLNPAWTFLISGDFNIQTSNEAAYQEMVGSQTDNSGRVFDPIATPGTWNNNGGFSFVHTQDPTGAGGMDDRHDQILLSIDLLDNVGLDYIGLPDMPFSTSTWNDPNHSYRVWGNDGTSFNQTLRTDGNTMVGPVIAQALVSAAASGGHLPVYLDLMVPAKVGSETYLDFGQVNVGDSSSLPLHVANAANVALWGAPGIADLHYSLSASAGFTAPAGSFVSEAGAAPNLHAITMDTSTPGQMQGTLTIASDDPDQPTRVVILVGEVVAPCPADFNGDGFLTGDDFDEFIAAFETGDEAADFNNDEFVSGEDFDEYVLAFEEGC